MTGLQFAEHRTTAPTEAARRAEILAAPGFGQYFTDHMVTATWTPDDGWHDAGLEPYGPLRLDPASAVLHYAQEIFEGLKVYRHPDGSLWAFRPEANAERFNRSARRLALPELPTEDFLASLELLVRTDADWVPSRGEDCLYLRPFMFASEKFLGVRPASRVSYLAIASPVGAYFSGGVTPVSIWLSDTYTRAAVGGTGSAKCGGNYAASLLAGNKAHLEGYTQVLWLDGVEQKYLEEVGSMNIFFVIDNEIVTPELNGSILPGITRKSVIELAKHWGKRSRSAKSASTN